MSTSLPRPTVPRQLSHTRRITCEGYEREDGLWDIEGHLVDVKTSDWPKRSGGDDLPAGSPAHEMWLRLTIDLDMNIHEAVAVTSAGPHAGCGDVTSKFRVLVGRRIDRGWLRGEVAESLRGVQGCTHQWELLGRVATTAFQSTNRARAARVEKSGLPPPRPRVLGTCHMYAVSSDVVRWRWPAYFVPLDTTSDRS